MEYSIAKTNTLPETNRPEKWIFGLDEHFWGGPAYFQEQLVIFREGNRFCSVYVSKRLLRGPLAFFSQHLQLFWLSGFARFACSLFKVKLMWFEMLGQDVVFFHLRGQLTTSLNQKNQKP